MEAKEVRYSFLIPTDAREGRLVATLQSLEELQAPTGLFEVVVVFDGEMPASLKEFLGERASTLPLVVLEQEQSGPASARNLAASHARGEWIVFLDDDCRVSPDFLRVLELALNPGVRLAIGGKPRTPDRVGIWTETSHIIVEAFIECQRDASGAFGFLPSQNLVLHRTAWETTGGFDIDFVAPAGEDREFCYRWIASGGCLVRLEQLRYIHDHFVGFWKFLQKHRQYGNGAVRFWQKSGTTRGSRYAAFLLEAARRIKSVHPRRRIPALVAALMLSQIATLVGIFARAPNRTSGRPSRVAESSLGRQP